MKFLPLSLLLITALVPCAVAHAIHDNAVESGKLHSSRQYALTAHYYDIEGEFPVEYSGFVQLKETAYPGLAPFTTLRVYTKGLPTQQRFGVNVTLADGTRQVAAKFHEQGTGEILDSFNSIIPQPAIRLSWGDVVAQSATEVAADRLEASNIQSITVTDDAGRVRFSCTPSASDSQTFIRNVEMRVLGSTSAPAAKGHVTAFYKVYFGSLNHDLFHLSARHLPPNATLNVVVNGTALGQYTTTATGRLKVDAGGSRPIGKGYLPFPTTLDFSSVSEVTVTDAQGNVVLSGSL